MPKYRKYSSSFVVLLLGVFTPIHSFQVASVIRHKSFVLPVSTLRSVGTHYDDHFDEMQAMESRLSAMVETASEGLIDFYEPHLKSFSVKPGKAERLSITSTCFALLALRASGRLDDTMIMLDFVEDDNDPRISIRAILKELVGSEWREEDLFQVPLLLYTLLSVDPDRVLLGPSCMDETIASKIRSLISAVLSARPQRKYGSTQNYSDYIVYQVTQVLCLLQDSAGKEKKEGHFAGLPEKALPDGVASEVSLALSRCAEMSKNALCKQIAYRYSGDTTSFDIMQLAYSLLTYIKATTSLSGTAGRELVPGEGPSIGSKVGALNKRLVTASLQIFFDEQRGDGLWEKGQPIYKSFRKQGRNVGNAFVFAVDTVGTLLEVLPPEEFRPHLGALKRTLDWIENHLQMEVIPDYCDPETGMCYGKAIRGWNSPHLDADLGPPQAWATAQVLTCVEHMRRSIRKMVHTDVLEEFNGASLSKKGIRTASWERLLDSDIGKPDDHSRTIKSVLEERVITPFEKSVSKPSYGAAYSTILFGPPGTAKTTICESLAQRMGWDFVVIDTAAFLADGLSNVAARIRYVFRRLQALDRCVILFDEIEEFCLDRETVGLGMESRMLTTAMLTAINDLRRAKRSIFFVATNRLRAFDSAITRPGRFDLQLFVGTPNLHSKVLQFEQQLSSMSIDQEVKAAGIAAFETFLESVWEEDAMFMNFLEGLQFASACAKIVGAGSELTKEDMQRLFERQAAVMTVRGSARKEYLASMKLSRL